MEDFGSYRPREITFAMNSRLLEEIFTILLMHIRSTAAVYGASMKPCPSLVLPPCPDNLPNVAQLQGESQYANESVSLHLI